jgi:hypothetical protein
MSIGPAETEFLFIFYTRERYRFFRGGLGSSGLIRVVITALLIVP